MSKALQDALVHFLNLLQAGANFAIQQLPDVLQQWLYYRATWDIILIVICSSAILIVMTVFIVATRKMVHCEQRTAKRELWEFVAGLSGMGGGLFVVLPSIVCLFSVVPDLLMINLAPKVWLIQHISQLVN